jgi:hypothetical protein
MTKLSHIANEARRQVGRLAESKLHNLQDDLVKLCEAYWREIRGPEPAAPLAHALWSATPPLSDLYVDLHGASDMRLDEVLGRMTPSRGLAVLVLAEIERGDMEGLHIAYESMMIFESPAAAQAYTEQVASSLRGELKTGKLPRNVKREPLCKALAALIAHTGRHDLKAVTESVRLLVAEQSTSDEALEDLRMALNDAGIHFCSIGDDKICFDLNGRAHKPVRLNRILDTLLEIRQTRLG